MYFIHGGRATGKTTMLIQQSAMTGVPIMTTNFQRIVLYKERAKEMGLKIPEPILWNNRKEGMEFDKHQVLIDDGERFLDYVLLQTAGVRCAGVTICEPIFELGNRKDSTFPDAHTVQVCKICKDVYLCGKWENAQTEE